MKLRGLDQLDIPGKTVLLRTDYNVPLKDGKVHDDFRIRASLPTIQYLLKNKCRIIIVSHLGRPEGKVATELSLRPVAQRLTDLLRQKISFVQTIDAAKASDAPIVMLENLRFDAREEANDAAFVQELASLADVYIDDAFAVIHRAHASTVGVASLLPSAAGLLVQQEVNVLSGVLAKPTKPFLAIAGGAKVADKIDLLEQLIAKANALFVGGAMANTFLASQGIAIGQSMFESDELKEAKRLLAKARRNNVRVILPTDVVVVKKIEAGQPSQLINLSDIAADDIIVDIGPKTIKMALDLLTKGGTVLWNGPLGVDEIPEFAKGTLKLARGIIASKAHSVIGGGDTADVMDKAGLHKKFSFVSTGGGAALELLAGKELPGLAILTGEQSVPKAEAHVVLSAGEQHQKTGPLIIANWKANLTLPQAIRLAEATNAAARGNLQTRVVICPPSIYTTLLRHGLGSLYVDFGVQDVSQYEVGTHTGDLPASIAAQVASYAIIGHSERRAQHHETDKVVAAKVVRTLQAGLQPIICVGERLVDKQHGHAKRRVHDQLEVALHNVTADELDQVIITYEPVWAISSGDGHGHVATPVQVEAMVAHIKLLLQSRYGKSANRVRILYGGSVNGENASAYTAIKGIDGLLVGGASLNAHDLAVIIGN
jgi:triosephosphate isomerase